MTWLLLAGAIGTEVTGTMFLRASEGLRKKKWIVPFVLSYLTAFSLLTLALVRGMPVGIAYGIWAACGVALTALCGHLFFHERLTKRMVAGVILIAAGVLIIELGAQTHV